MALLHIALQEGFSGDSVLIRVNGKEAFQKANVKTRNQIGLADSFEFTVPESSATVEVSLSSRNVSESIRVNASQSVYLGVSLTPEGKLSHRISQEPFCYL